MTITDLRLIENFLDDAAEHGMDLTAARKWVSARILGSELHSICPGLTVDAVTIEAEHFLTEIKG